jgi:hypothetical protein
VILELAENANTHTALGPGEERLVDERFVVWLGPTPAAWFTVVQRLRLEPATVEPTLVEIRRLLGARGRREASWEVAASATPPDLADRLLELGLVPDAEPEALGMVLDAPPASGASPPGVVARRVRTLDEYVTAERIAATEFGLPAGLLEERLAAAEPAFAAEGSRGATFLAFLDGRPVARATSAYTPHGVLLFGGATLADARGRGAYRALVQARWDDAVDRGTPALVTHAGALSLPILRRLGFRELSRIRILRDAFGSPP